MHDLLNSLKLDALRILKLLMNYDEKQQRLYDTAYSFLGTDASPDDLANDMLGCMESASRILQTAFPELNFPTFLATREGWDYFERSPSFQPCEEDEGVILIYVTGTGNGNVSNGHIFITGKRFGPDGTRWLMSNNSYTGTWEVTGTLGAARRFYRDRGGFPEYLYRVV